MAKSSGLSSSSRKHSSTTSRASASRHRASVRSSRGRGTVRPVGLLGWQRNTRSISGATASGKPSPRAKPSSARRGNRSVPQPASSNAASYSAKAGAVTKARRGRPANAARQIRSAAPFPHSTQSGLTPSARAMASPRARHRGSG